MRQHEWIKRIAAAAIASAVAGLVGQASYAALQESKGHLILTGSAAGKRRDELFALGPVFTALDKAKSELGIETYTLSQTTLEQVFLNNATHVTKDDLFQRDVCSIAHVEKRDGQILPYMYYRFGLQVDFLVRHGHISADAPGYLELVGRLRQAQCN